MMKNFTLFVKKSTLFFFITLLTIVFSLPQMAVADDFVGPPTPTPISGSAGGRVTLGPTGASVNPFEYAHSARTPQGALAGQLTGMALKIGVNFGINAAVQAMTAGNIAKQTADTATNAIKSVPISAPVVERLLGAPTVHDTADNNHQFVLKGIAKMIAEQIVHQIAVSIVNWINTGFKGGPAFVTDLPGFMENIADTVTVDFINRSGILNTPFGPAIAQGIINARNGNFSLTPVYAGALAEAQNVDRFLGGNFYAGGLNGFYEMSQNCQNNYQCAYLASMNEVNKRVQKATNFNQKILDWGQGFQSKSVCDGTYIPKGTTVDSKTGLEKFDESGNATASQGQSSCDHQSIATPGSVIRENLNRAVDSDFVTLQNVHDINEIINALMGQLINVVTTNVDGLAGVSAPSRSRVNNGQTSQVSFLDDFNGGVDPAALQSIKDPILSQMDASIEKAKDLSRPSLYGVALIKVEGAESLTNQLKSCYEYKLDPAYTPPLSDIGVSLAKIHIDSASTTLSTKIAPVKKALAYEISIIDTKAPSLQKMRDALATSTSITEVNKILDTYKSTYPNETANTTADDMQNVTDQMDAVTADIQPQLDECLPPTPTPIP